MSQDNLDAVKAVYDRWGAGDFSRSPDIFDSETEIVWAREMPDLPAGARGDEVGATMRAFLAPWDEYRWEADNIMPAGDERILVLFTARGRGKGSNIEVKAQWAHVWTFRAGKATRVEGFIDQSEALNAAGLSE
jgi:ketosteroid isomerase-like protein